MRTLSANIFFYYREFYNICIQDAFVVEVFRNVAGIAYIPDFLRRLHDMNIRKFQNSFSKQVANDSGNAEVIPEPINDNLETSNVDYEIFVTEK